jgi:hypothetical protein
MEETRNNWLSRLAAPALAALMVACCLAGPLIIGALGTLTAGAVFGVGAAVIALLAACLYVGYRLASDRRC